MDDAAADQARARRWRSRIVLALLLGVAAVGAAVVLRSSPRPWVVEVHIERPGLSYDDPCSPMPNLVTGGYTTGGGSYGGLLLTDTGADAQAVADCYREHGATVEVRRETDEDAQWVKEVGG